MSYIRFYIYAGSYSWKVYATLQEAVEAVAKDGGYVAELLDLKLEKKKEEPKKIRKHK